MRAARWLGQGLGVLLCCWLGVAGRAPAQQDASLIFAVIIEAPTDKSRVIAEALAGEKRLGEVMLLADEGLQRHVMWRQLEMCQSVKAEVIREPDGYRVLSFKMVGASMLPMQLQGVAGDCMLKKALEYAPLLE